MSVKGTECSELCGVIYVKPRAVHMKGDNGLAYTQADTTLRPCFAVLEHICLPYLESLQNIPSYHLLYANNHNSAIKILCSNNSYCTKV